MVTGSPVQSLHDWQLELIAESDVTESGSDPRSTWATNVGESDITLRRHHGRTWIYKMWQSDRHPGIHHLYAPATGQVHQISRRQAELLQARTWEQVDSGEAHWRVGDDEAHSAPPSAAELAELGRLIAPFENDGWRFPELPPGASRDEPRIRVLMLNPTEQCNIRCTYCYYGGAYPGTRPHQTASPATDTVKNAIDLFVNGDERLELAHRAVYFFGGEPLMAFDRIREAVFALEARKQEVGSRLANLVVQVNSNGMLLNQEMVEFLIAHDIYLNISIDGPNHDRYRLDRRGQGTHDRVRERVDWLAEHWPDYFATRVALICVLSAPLDEAALYRYFSQWPTARRALAWDFDLVLPGGEESYSELEAMFAQQRRVWDLFVEAHRHSYADRERSGRFHFAFSHGFLHRSFHRALNQSVRPGGPRLRHLLGVQLRPGDEYLVLGADGTLYSSYEYQSPDFAVGHTDRGVDPEAGLAQLAMFRDAVQASACRTCWAAPMCTVTVPEAPFRRSDTAEVVRSKVAAKRQRCRSERENLAQALRAREDIAHAFGDDVLQGHRADWDEQRRGGSRIDYFYA